MLYTPYQSEDLRVTIRNTLMPLGLWSTNAEELLLATCAQESLFGTYRTQAPHGPARGIFQMEGEDFNDIWNNYLKYKGTLAFQVRNYNHGQQGDVDDLVDNDNYAIAMARVHYLRQPGALPDATDLEGLWKYYKQYYNTPGGAATQEEFNRNYKKYVTDGKAK